MAHEGHRPPFDFNGICVEREQAALVEERAES
jgi:hypothetical protein